ncbi:MAG: type II toxin-antitoxin system RelE/ParE family toxin [Acidobacteria bacterium]|nr:MAG: type II toxin-antitoxin system RelE/ParE family toxin [Acidobacteriota bacterium]
MARLSWTREAVVSLREIHDYIARDRPATAFRTVESIIDKVQSLTGAPELGQRYTYLPEQRVHHLSYGHFRIAYLLAPNADGDDDVVILGVFHGLIFLPLR